MSIDQSLIYAKKYEADPTPLKQAVLGASPQGLDIDPYTALRALQHIDQSRQMQMAQQAQQAPMANAQPSIADATLAKAFGTGGIVAFAMGGTPMQHYDERGLTDSNVSDEDANDARVAREDEQENGVGDATGLNALYERAQGLKAPTPLTAAEREAAIQQMIANRENKFGPDIYKPQMDRLDKQEGLGLKAKDQGLGLSLLKAAAAMSQGSNLGRAAANAAGAFGESYGDVLKEERAAQEHRDAMRFHMADAQRKDKMGQYALAADSVHKSQQEGIAAHNAEINALKAQADVLKARNISLKPGAQINPTNLLFNAKEEYRLNPTPDNAAKVKNAEQAIEKTKTTNANIFSVSDITGNKATQGETGLDIKQQEIANTQKKLHGAELKSLQRSVAYMDANPATQEQMEEALDVKYPLAKHGKVIAPTPAAAKPTRSGNIPLPSGFIPD
jgi:hypothetical protein